jgi:hypothetical protein
MTEREQSILKDGDLVGDLGMTVEYFGFKA